MPNLYIGDIDYCLQMKFVKVMFLHVSVCPQGGVPGQVHPPGRYTPGQVHPQAGTPPGRYTPWTGTPQAGTPPRQVHPLAGTPPGRYTPRQVHPWAGTPSLGRHTPPGRYTLGRYTPRQVHTPPGRYTPPGLLHCLGRYTPTPQAGTPPLREQCMLGDTDNKRAVRILLECILVFECVFGSLMLTIANFVSFPRQSLVLFLL